MPLCFLRKQEQRERVRQMLAETRSGHLALEHANPDSVPGLAEALNALVGGIGDRAVMEARTGLDLKRYEDHVLAHAREYPVSLAAMPPLEIDLRTDLIWRFIAVIFVAHAGVVDIWQEGQEIMVMKHEANREGQDISGEPEAVDGVEGLVG